MPILLAVATWMRRGEILALRWQDVDHDAGTLSVRQALEQTAGRLSFKAPRSAKSRRAVTLPRSVVEALVRHRGQQAEQRPLLGPGYKDHGQAIAQEDGRPWQPDQLTHAFAGLIARSDLPRVRFHDLRHSHATQLLKRGVNVKVISERLGHSTATLTLDVYSHVLPGMQEAARHVDAALRGAFS